MKYFLLLFIFIILFNCVFALSSRPVYVTPSNNYHIVQEGETLQDISRIYDISEKKLMVYNNLKDRRIFVGQKIYLYPRPKSKREYITKRAIPQNHFHIVQERESIYRISKMYDVGIIELIDYNNLAKLELESGQKIYLTSQSAKNRIHAKKSDTSSSTEKAYEKIEQKQNSARIYTTEPSAKLQKTPKIEKEPVAAISPRSFEKIPDKRKSSSAGLILPVEGKVTSEFGIRNGRHHKGIDIAADVGEPICAVSDGKVVYVGSQRGYGNVVILEHDDYVMTVYAHNETNLVRLGETVKQGQPIATLGNTGSTDGPHLHFEYRVQGKALNPKDVLPGL